MFLTIRDTITTTTKSRLAIYLGTALAVYYLVSSIHLAFKKGLRDLPGPFSARFTGWYRFSLVAVGRAPQEYGKVHERYGHIVRVGPNHVSISDPAVIPQIYGIGSNYAKVSQALPCPNPTSYS
jgi:hypothetical protein